MNYDFDNLINRENTGSLKYDYFKERGKPAGLIPMWVADMDFKTAPCIIDALKNVADHGIFGYSEPDKNYFPAMRDWFLKHYNFQISQEWHVQTPGVVFALAHAVRAFTNIGDSIIIQPPVYYPFSEVILDNDRVLIESPLVRSGDTYVIDFDAFEKKIIDNKVVMFILCSPHNPVGRVWTHDELTKLGNICLRHGVIVISDEIHADFVYSGYKHYVFGSLHEDVNQISMICTSRGKSFNQAGLQVSDIFIANPSMRKKLLVEINKSGYSQRNTFGLIGAKVAYEHGADWLKSLLKYLECNRDLIVDFLSKNFPEIRVARCEGTYLAWLDFSNLGIPRDELLTLITNHAKLWLDDGLIFGKEGIMHQRMNFGCPRATLKRALDQLMLLKPFVRS
ncbi:MAG: pyridoxal phosphate-dependent aminotransferase [Christensenellaceae bacterium]|jgi:cystathionine beta-lyase|nr:pyridoxal phosphate-dependent aminotransferase [Christensenellaceae bacterium]